MSRTEASPGKRMRELIKTKATPPEYRSMSPCLNCSVMVLLSNGGLTGTRQTAVSSEPPVHCLIVSHRGCCCGLLKASCKVEFLVMPKREQKYKKVNKMGDTNKAQIWFSCNVIIFHSASSISWGRWITVPLKCTNDFSKESRSVK